MRRSKKASEPSSLGQYILLKMAAVDPVTAFAARTLILSTLAAYAWHQHDVTVGVWCPVPMLVASDVISTCGFVRSFGGHSIHSRESCPVLPRHPHQADDQRLPHCPPVVVPDCAIPSLLLLVSMGNAVLSNLFWLSLWYCLSAGSRTQFRLWTHSWIIEMWSHLSSATASSVC